MNDALGLVEVIGFIPAVAAADGGLKAANVRLKQIFKVDGGIVTVAFTGDVGAVRSAVEAGAKAAEDLSAHLRSAHVIARLEPQTAALLWQPETVRKPPAGQRVKNFMAQIPLNTPPEVVPMEDIPSEKADGVVPQLAASVAEAPKSATKGRRSKKTTDGEKENS